jgi:hypothetical protein
VLENSEFAEFHCGHIAHDNKAAAAVPASHHISGPLPPRAF